MSEENLNTLYDELWRNYDKFKFEPFIGHTETERTGKFVNFTEEEGRKVIRPLNCNLNIYLYTQLLNLSFYLLASSQQ